MIGRVRSLTIDGRIGVPTPLADHLRIGGCDPQGHCITVNSRYLLKDGRPWLPVIGGFHFSRYPAELWEEELLKVNYSPLKRGACPWRCAMAGASETFGRLTTPRLRIFTAAMWSASPEKPQTTQEKIA